MEPAVERNAEDLRASQTDRKILHERMGKVDADISGTKEQIVEMKLDIISHVNELKQLVVADNGKLRERIVRLETVNEIERKLGKPLSVLMGDKE